jgi:protease I
MLVSHLYQSGSRHHFSKGVLKNREETAKLQGKKIGILIESDFYEHEIWYYHYRFAEEVFNFSRT